MNIMQNRYSLELIKVGVISAIPNVLLRAGVDPISVARDTGLSLEMFADPENVVPFAALARLLNDSAKATHCEHFGLLVGQQASASSLGLVGLLVEQSGTVLDALENLARYLHLQDGRGIPTLAVAEGTALLGYRVIGLSIPGTLEFVDAAVATRFNILRRLCGSSWRPTEVALPRARPHGVRPFDSFFGVHVRFGEAQGAISFSAEWLRRPVPGANPMLRELLEERVREDDAKKGESFRTRLRRFIRMLVLTKRCSLGTVARLFAIEPRSLARRLAREKIEFRCLVEEVRYEIARQLISDTSLPMTEVAAILGYSEASAFTRAFRRWSDTTPRSWRAEHIDARVEMCSIKG
jgi:AraC-like DNA-binding protein